ncbi:MAG: helix-turn-helix domain-containing protein [Tumebacillaceae bacterium]
MSDFFDRYAKVVGDDRVKQLRQEGSFIAQMIQARHSKNVSQQALADSIGVAKSTIARIESGTNNPNLDTIMKIARALGVDFIIRGNQEDELDDRMLLKL